MDEFWQAIDDQLELLRQKGTTADLVCQILPAIPSMSAGGADGFFAGSGGDVQVSEVLQEIGWTYVWAEAHYHWCMKDPEGRSRITYVEGDLYKDDRR